MSSRMQLVNLSLMSAGNKGINPGLTYFLLPATPLHFINLSFAPSAGSKANFKRSLVCGHSPLLDIWNRLFFSNFLNTLPLISTNCKKQKKKSHHVNQIHASTMEVGRARLRRGSTHVVRHHDGEQGLVVGVEGDIEGGGLDHDEDGMENCIEHTLRTQTH